jgi:hypothetical protein
VSRGIYAPIPTVAREALYELAEREWRDPREQAAKLIVEGLERAGALTVARSGSCPEFPKASDTNALEVEP